MKTIKLCVLVSCALYLVSCQKSKGLEKSGGDYPKHFIYSGLAVHDSKYYRWEGEDTFTEISDVEFPDEVSADGVENSIREYYDEFYFNLELTLESDTTLRFKAIETEDNPAIDTILNYQDYGSYIALFEEFTTDPYTFYFNDESNSLDSRGHSYNFNFYDDFHERRDYWSLHISEGDRRDKTEAELLQEIVTSWSQFIQPKDTIQLKLFEVVHTLEK